MLTLICFILFPVVKNRSIDNGSSS